ncbi:hypothetical protein CVIRNUC_005094 [Coccomyxa viridis]|uniref:Translation initiation factor eIF2B subunit gamma n=1 Tax=Coccomyxa viridis TaxID=1274662 RepID=A0AAV1I4W6_9CHLO|nr:hypothetical protein CVIRNUC_005094 [Coccomyxa viridis]
MGPEWQAVLLAGGAGASLFPLNHTGNPLALLPIANQPLITYALRSLEQADILDVLLVCSGEATAAKITSWAKNKYIGKLRLKTRSVPEDSESGDALRMVAEDITAQSFVVMSIDLITDVRLESLLAVHFLRNASATALLSHRKVSPASETKLGKAPKDVEYVALDGQMRRLVFFRPSPESRRNIKLPMGTLMRHGRLTIRTDLQDNHVYALDRSVLGVLHAKPSLASIKQDLIPYLVLHQHASTKAAAALRPDSSGTPSANGQPEPGSMAAPGNAERLSPGCDYISMSHTSADVDETAAGTSYCGAFVAAPEQYCARTVSLQSFSEVNREVVNVELAARLGVRAKPNAKHDNFVDESVQIGSKSMVAAGCMVGPGATLGDKCSIKRSVLGPMCKLGSNVKIINCVLMDSVIVHDGCHLQNCIICTGAELQERVSLRDCQVGPGFTVSEGAEHREEVLAKAPQQRRSSDTKS